MRCRGSWIRWIALTGLFALLSSAPALAGSPKAPGMKPGMKPPPGPAKKMKVLAFVTGQTYGILKIQFLDAKGTPTKAPDGGTMTYRTNVTKPRKGGKPMTAAKWKPKDKVYVFTGLAPRQRYVCPPRSYWIRVWVKVGRKRFSAFKRTKFNCL